MDSKAALEKIKEAEEKAQAIIDEAKKESHKMLYEASLGKDNIARSNHDKIRSESALLKQKTEEETRREVSQIDIRAKEEAGRIKDKAAPNIDKAADLLAKKLGL